MHMKISVFKILKLIFQFSKLKQHLLSHANLREFKCDQCDCAYNTKPRLRRHYIYNHTDHPTFDCSVCGWKFREKNNLKRHMRLHNNDYQAQCQICDKKFTANCHLKYHMNTAHSSETPYQVNTWIWIIGWAVFKKRSWA